LRGVVVFLPLPWVSALAPPLAFPRAGLALLRAARAYALLLGREHAVPEDVQALFNAVAAHRLVGDADAGDGASLARAILHAVPVD